jgi:hypothetical protein
LRYEKTTLLETSSGEWNSDMVGSNKLRRAGSAVATIALLLTASQAIAADWVVRPEWVKAHEDFLASTPLQGRGSATRDEAIAAAYVSSEFETYGLKPAPEMNGYIQVGRIVRPHGIGTPTLKFGGGPALSSLSLIVGGGEVSGSFASFDGSDPAKMPSSTIVIVTNPQSDLRELAAAAQDKQVKLLIVPDSPATRRIHQATGGGTLFRPYLEGATAPPARTILATLSASDIATLAASKGQELTLSAPVASEIAETTNAIGYLPGTDPNAGILLISAHLDHLGMVDGTIMPGANDDASGTTAVIELAHALASGKPMRRGILFVCYGSEELGGLGSRYFGEHPPVPLTSIVANLELEMIGAQDPKLPAGYLMMTGFERSDNYSLALKGIVAHTVSGWAVVPTYHEPTDTIANLDIAFMTRAIQSLIAPLRFIADGNETPHWKPGGRPEEK